MTNNRLFTFLMISLIGGFILSTPCSALAKAQNDEKEKSVLNWMQEYGIKAAEQGGIVLTRQKLIQDAKKDFEEKYKVFEKKRDALRDNCARSYAQRVKDQYEKLAKQYKAAKQDFKESDGFWNSLKSSIVGTAQVSWETIKLALEANGTAGNWDKFTDSMVNEASEWMLGDDVSYIAQVNYISGMCGDSGKTEFDKDIEQLAVLAEELETINFNNEIMEKKGYSDEIYIHCPPANDTSCVADASKGENFEAKCCSKFVVNTEKNAIMSIEGASAGCAPLPFKLYEARSCLFCPLFDTIFKTVQRASTTAFAKLSGPLSTLVLIGLSIWIAFMVLANVSSMTKQDAPKFLNDLFKASFKVIIVFILLRNATIIYDLIIGPLLKAGFDFGASFLTTSSGEGVLSNCSAKLAESKSDIAGVLPNYIYSSLLCFIESVQYELATTQAIGSSLMCISVNQGSSNLAVVAKVLPDFTMMMQGALIYIISFILSLAFGFYLIDATISLGIFGVLLPFLLLCWPFKPTNGYFKKGVEVFMNSWFVYVFMGIVVSITMQLIAHSLSGGKGGFDEIMRAINGNEVKTLQSLLDIGFAGFLILVACCVFGVKLMMKVESLAGQFAGGGLGLGMGAKVGGLAASTATAGTKAAVGAVGGAIKSGYNAKIWEEKDENGNYTGKFRSAHDGVRKVTTKVGQRVGRGIQNAADATGEKLGKAANAVTRPIRRSLASMHSSFKNSKRRNNQNN